MKRLLLSFIVIVLLSSFYKKATLKGVWEYAGGISKGKYFAAPKNYAQQRKYTDDKFDAFLLEKGEKPVKYESGNYTLKNDTCFEMQTYCLQDQNMIGKTINYLYTIRHDTLVLKGILPNGAAIEDSGRK